MAGATGAVKFLPPLVPALVSGLRTTATCDTPRVTALTSRTRTLLFIGGALAINTIDALAIRMAAGTPRAAWVGAGAVVDLVGVVTLLYWSLLVRRGLRGRASLAVVAAVSAVRATLLLPTPAPLRLAVVGALEVAVVGAMGWAVWSARRRMHASNAPGDIVDTLRGAASRLLPMPAVAEVVALELAVLAYAFGLAPQTASPTARAFPMVRRSGLDGLVGVITFAGLVEIAVMHLLLSRWSPVAAWLATASGVYGLLYLCGLTRAIAGRPVLVGDDRLVLRYGLTFQLAVPVDAIVSMAPASRGATADVTLPRRRTPAWMLTFDAALEARGLFGRRQLVRTVAITVDDDAAFGRAVGDLIARRTGRTS